MVLKRINGAPDSPPKPFVGPVPEYPKSLRKAGVKGEVLVTMRITRQGVVVDPCDSERDRSGFRGGCARGRSSVALSPANKGGRPVDTSVTMPFGFDPPQGVKNSRSGRSFSEKRANPAGTKICNATRIVTLLGLPWATTHQP